MSALCQKRTLLRWKWPLEPRRPIELANICAGPPRAAIMTGLPDCRSDGRSHQCQFFGGAYLAQNVEAHHASYWANLGRSASSLGRRIGNVRFGSKADIGARLDHVPLYPQ